MKLIISHVRLFMIISHVKIIAFQTIIIHCLWIFYIARKDCSSYNKQNNTCLLRNTIIPDLFLVLNMIYVMISRYVMKHDITFNTRNISGISAHPCIILYMYTQIGHFHGLLYTFSQRIRYCMHYSSSDYKLLQN